MFSHKSYLKIGDFTSLDFTTLTKTGYELADCEYFFEQGIDYSGKASTGVFGGTIAVTLQTLPSQEIIDWAIRSTKYNKGAVIILDEMNDPHEKVLFENAACIKMKINYALQGTAYITTDIVIQAERLLFSNGFEFDNFWTK